MRKKPSLLLALALVLSAGYFFQQYGFPVFLKNEETRKKTVNVEGPADTKANASALPHRAAQTQRPPAEPPVAIVRGRVSLRGSGGNALTTVTVFNGFEPVETGVLQDGTYNVLLRRSSEGTFISVFADHDLFVPQVRSVRLSFKEFGSFDDFGRLPLIDVPEMVLAPSNRTDLGSLLGVAYVRTVSGRPRSFEGILQFDPGQVITVTRAGESGAAPTSQTRLEADKDGNYFAQLPPGTYSILTDRNIVVDNVTIVRGRTTVVPIFSGEQMNF